MTVLAHLQTLPISWVHVPFKGYIHTRCGGRALGSYSSAVPPHGEIKCLASCVPNSDHCVAVVCEHGAQIKKYCMTRSAKQSTAAGNWILRCLCNIPIKFVKKKIWALRFIAVLSSVRSHCTPAIALPLHLYCTLACPWHSLQVLDPARYRALCHLSSGPGLHMHCMLSIQSCSAFILRALPIYDISATTPLLTTPYLNLIHKILLLCQMKITSSHCLPIFSNLTPTCRYWIESLLQYC